MVLVTGGAGFIGSNFVLEWFKSSEIPEPVITLDSLTYAGNLDNLCELRFRPDYRFVRGDIGDQELICSLLASSKPRAIVHFAAESHVDRSIHGPTDFIKTNIQGTFNLLECSRAYWSRLPKLEADRFRFLHVSTDEVYGSLSSNEPPVNEATAYNPNSPYSASKAASNHLVRAWHRTYGLPVLTTNCSNNYGPFQFPEKLIPVIITNALAGKPLPIYGDGLNIRDWLYVADHCSAIRSVIKGGSIGEVYNIGGRNEISNIKIVKIICDLLDQKSPQTAIRAGGKHERLITHVADRPGHDRRYAIDATKIHRELGWEPTETFETGIIKTVDWYLRNKTWVQRVQSGVYQK